jgi:hypothetical protein
MEGKTTSEHISWRPFFAGLAIVLGLWVAWAWFGVQFLHRYLSTASAARAPAAPSIPIAELGQVGDLFGGINALFAAFAVAGVFWAGHLQRTALLEARTALAAQLGRQDRQQFEATFFHLIALSKDSCNRYGSNTHTPARATRLTGYLFTPRSATYSETLMP